MVTLTGDTIRATKKQKISYYLPVREITVRVNGEKMTFKPDSASEVFTYVFKNKITGVPYEDQWIFQVFSTPDATFYSPFPVQEITGIAYFRSGEGEIKKISAEDMKIIMEGNEKALKALNKGKMTTALAHYYKAAKKSKRLL